MADKIEDRNTQQTFCSIILAAEYLSDNRCEEGFYCDFVTKKEFSIFTNNFWPERNQLTAQETKTSLIFFLRYQTLTHKSERVKN